MNGVVLFDGECNLCDASVSRVMTNDPQQHFRFASLQSQAAADLLAPLGRRPDEFTSIVLVADGRIATASTAALLIARGMRFPWSLLGLFMIVPRPLRDVVYGFIAANRYRWFGRRATCRIPTEADRARFL